MPRGKVGEELPDRFLPALAGLDFLEPCLLVLLIARGELREPALAFHAGDPFRGRPEVEAQGSLHRDLLEAEVGVVEYLAHHPHAPDRLLGDRVFLREGARLAILKVAEDPRDIGDLVGLARPVGRVAELVALVAETLRHLHEEAPRVDELDLALAPGLLAVGEHPDIGGDPSVVEELVRQGRPRLRASRSR